jgi:hypothetical protein
MIIDIFENLPFMKLNGSKFSVKFPFKKQNSLRIYRGLAYSLSLFWIKDKY